MGRAAEAAATAEAAAAAKVPKAPKPPPQPKPPKPPKEPKPLKAPPSKASGDSGGNGARVGAAVKAGSSSASASSASTSHSSLLPTTGFVLPSNMPRATKKELEQIRYLLQQNPESPLAQLLKDAVGGHAAAGGVNMQHPAAAMQALVGLLRSRTRDAMQLSILQLHQSIASHMAQPGQMALPTPSAPSPMLMSPSALSALLTPTGSGFRVDFGAALKAIEGGQYNVHDPLDVALSPLPSPPRSAKGGGGKGVKRTASELSASGTSMPPPDAVPAMNKRPSRSASLNPSALGGANAPGSLSVSVGNVFEATTGGGMASSGRSSSRKSGGSASSGGLRMPEGLGSLSVEVSGAAVEPGQLSISTLSNAPLSAILGAFGFVSPGRDGKFGALPIPPSAGGGLPAFPQSALLPNSATQHVFPPAPPPSRPPPPTSPPSRPPSRRSPPASPILPLATRPSSASTPTRWPSSSASRRSSCSRTPSTRRSALISRTQPAARHAWSPATAATLRTTFSTRCGSSAGVHARGERGMTTGGGRWRMGRGGTGGTRELVRTSSKPPCARARRLVPRALLHRPHAQVRFRVEPVRAVVGTGREV